MNATTDVITIERERTIQARPETIWPFLTEPDKLSRWMGVDPVLDPRPGGIYEVEVCAGSVARGEFVELDPPHRVVWTWGWEPGSGSEVPPGASTIEVQLIPMGGATLLRFRHTGLPTQGEASSHAHGWEHYLDRLALAGGGGDPGVDPWFSRPPSQAG